MFFEFKGPSLDHVQLVKIHSSLHTFAIQPVIFQSILFTSSALLNKNWQAAATTGSSVIFNTTLELLNQTFSFF